MGPPQAEAALREALGFGADAAVLLSDKAFAGADTWATALTLARAVEKLGGADLIFCGKQAIDGDTAQVGPMLATILDIPYVAWARKLAFNDGGAVTVERLLDHGYDAVETSLPALITVVKEINEPRVPSFKAKLKAKKAAIPVWGIGDLESGCRRRGVERLLHPGGKGLPAARPGQVGNLDRRPRGTGGAPVAAAERAKQGAIVGAHRRVRPKGADTRSAPTKTRLAILRSSFPSRAWEPEKMVRKTHPTKSYEKLNAWLLADS